MNKNRMGNPNEPVIDKEQLWMAYLDGELSPSEALQLDAELTPEMRDRLAAELRLESALGDRLREGAACPDAVWTQTLAQLKSNEATTLQAARRATVRQRARRFQRRLWPLLSAAAVILLMSMGYLGTLFLQPEPAFAITAPDLETFARSASVPPEPAAIEDLLRTYGFMLQLGEINAEHPAELLGACHVLCRGMELVQILFNCCDYPVKIVVAPRHSKAAAMMLQGGRGTEIRAVRDVGNYRIALIGQHGKAELLELLELCTADRDHAAH